jgi:mono/diheme cytochrome c family protein
MKKALKWIGIVLGVVVVLAVVAVGVGQVRANALLTASHAFELLDLGVADDAASVAEGQYLVEHFMLCADCHGPDLGGAEFFGAEDGAGVLWAPNLTSGEGGIGGSYSDADWQRSLRHGIRPNGENLIIMPAEFYSTVPLEDMANMIAYLKTLPPVDRETPTRDLDFVLKTLLGVGVIPAEAFLPASYLDHNLVPDAAPEKGLTVEYGAYRAMVCYGCHGENLAGAPADPQSGFPATPNLTMGGEMSAWSEADFITTLQTGVTPTGREMDKKSMPWDRIGTADLEDLQAIWLYLQSLPALPTNE